MERPRRICRDPHEVEARKAGAAAVASAHVDEAQQAVATARVRAGASATRVVLLIDRGEACPR